STRMTDCSTATTFSLRRTRRVDVTFDQGHITENAGLLLLQQLDRREGLTRDLAALHDWRDPRFIIHSFEHRDKALRLRAPRAVGIQSGWVRVSRSARLRPAWRRAPYGLNALKLPRPR